MSLVFTKQADVWLGRFTVGAILLTGLGIAGLYYYGPPEYTRVGYAPVQPVPFSHAQHVGSTGNVVPFLPFERRGIPAREHPAHSNVHHLSFADQAR